MQVFISHAPEDTQAASDLSKQLIGAGYSVWDPKTEILPGDNWALKLGQALEDSDAIIVLVSSRTFNSEWMTREIQYALTAPQIKGRVIPVFLGPDKPAQAPWILQKLDPLTLQGKSLDWQIVLDKLHSFAG